jgi:hypothetical protein
MIYLNTIFENLSICIRPVSEKMPFKIYEGLFKCFTKKINVLERKEILKQSAIHESLFLTVGIAGKVRSK